MRKYTAIILKRVIFHFFHYDLSKFILFLPADRKGCSNDAGPRTGRTIDWFRYALSGPFGGISGRFFITFSLGYTLLLRWVPVTLTPLKAIRLAEHLPEEGLRVRSNWVPLRKVAMPMVRAVIATEDNHFLSHRGFDWDAIDRALDENREGKRLRGGSTISQQTAKNVFCLPARTWLRKGVEAWFTVLIETFWSKRRIMEVYLNVIETGRNMYGVEAPARGVYGKTAAELNAYEASMIATVLPNPAPPRHGRSVGLHGAPGCPGPLADGQARSDRIRPSRRWER